ncbi:hypothetical protein [Bacteriovorax sp. DB6_IX]|uniref:hypothetical protein n=1 Tax=Bacteriovorax sp. DB6_IX TaxID=1353530 RepID=UPI00038A2066|nr:hypothetical protein [Bacteriovorax sp. DB6_IX]EQC52321.1 hypothetical protein M901_2487 [Bacteriovorax sp. DB6_IX]
MGAIISLAVSFGISSVLFEGVWAFDITTPIITILGCIFLTLIITNLAITKALNTQTRELFHS